MSLSSSMRCLALIGGLAVGSLTGLTANPRAALTSFHPGQPWPDTDGVHLNAHGFCVLQHEGRYYWYGSHKIPGLTESEKNEAGVRCYVSRDLLNWEDAGLVLSVAAPGMHPDVADAGILDRPKVIYHTGTHRFILYFKLYPPKAAGGTTGTDVAYTGVAVGTQPTGTFEYQGKFLGAGSPSGSGDFAIFQDEDGAVYQICVRKPDKVLVCGRLTSDGLRPAGEYLPLLGVTRATEAPALFQRNGKTYLLGSGSTGWEPSAARVFVADKVTGPYQSLGNPCRGVNLHIGLGPEKTFGGQSTFVLPVAGRRDAWIAMFDINRPQDPVNSGYIWLPIRFENDQPIIEWHTEWNWSAFSSAPSDSAGRGTSP